MKTREREIILFNGEAYRAPDWLAEIIREDREAKTRELKRRHEPKSRRHWSELPEGETD